MRLRELKYPIAVVEPNSLMGGADAGLGSVGRWNIKVADYFLKGGYSEAKLIDSRGMIFAIKKIRLLPLRLIDKLISFIVTAGTIREKTNVDMELVHIRTYTLEEFCAEFRQLALDNPAWWKRHSSREEIEQMFDGCTTFADAINDIGVLDAPGQKKLPGSSDLVVDMR